MPKIIDPREKYALVDSNGNIVEKFRTCMAAKMNLSFYKRNLEKKVKVVKLESDKN